MFFSAPLQQSLTVHPVFPIIARFAIEVKASHGLILAANPYSLIERGEL